MDNQVEKVMACLANLAKVEMALRFLAKAGVVKEEAITKGCRKYVKDHPEIQAWIDTGALDMPRSNAEVRGDAPLYGAASLSTDGLESAPTTEKE